MKKITIPGRPIPWSRQTQSDKWKKRPRIERYRAWKDILKEHFGYPEKQLPDGGFILIFHMPMAKSWPNRKKELLNGTPHQQKPDKDNLVKGVYDALKEKDELIWSDASSKFWTDGEGYLEIILPEIQDEEDSPPIITLN